MAAGSTYTPIATTTLGSAAASYTFSSIPSTYTDLVIICNAKVASGGAVNTFMRFNGDTGSNYSATILYGTGSAAGSYRSTNNSTGIIFDDITSTEPNIDIINIMNYANTTTYKSTITRASVVGSTVQTSAGLWRSTAAINSVTIINPSTNLAAGSTFTLYGIQAA
jgi:hypothetical protein